jgi:hypothetical protein
MRNKFKFLQALIFLIIFALSITIVSAGDGGSVNGVGVITGDDGNKYIFINNSIGGAEFGAGSNRLNSEIYVPWDNNDPAYSVSQLSLLKDALKDPLFHIHVTRGTTTNLIVSGQWRVVGTQFSIRK